MKKSERNINFRQTPKGFSSRKRAAIFSQMNRNIPYKMYVFLRNFFNIQISKIKKQFLKIRFNLPKKANKIS